MPCLALVVCCEFKFVYYVFFFKQKTAYEMRISDWSSDVCSSDLIGEVGVDAGPHPAPAGGDADGLAVVQQRLEGRLELIVEVGEQIGRASCRERVCQYV